MAFYQMESLALKFVPFRGYRRMKMFQIYALLEYTAIIPLIAGIAYWRRISLFMRCQLFALLTMLIGDILANTSIGSSVIQSTLRFLFLIESPPNYNLIIYFVSYPIYLVGILLSWLNLEAYRKKERRVLYGISIVLGGVLFLWYFLEDWMVDVFYFQNYALIGLLHTGALLAISLHFFHVFLNSNLFKPQLNNEALFVAFSHLSFALPATYIIIFSEIYNSDVATDIWIGREISYVVSNILIFLAFFVGKESHSNA